MDKLSHKFNKVTFGDSFDKIYTEAERQASNLILTAQRFAYFRKHIDAWWECHVNCKTSVSLQFQEVPRDGIASARSGKALWTLLRFNPDSPWIYANSGGHSRFLPTPSQTFIVTCRLAVVYLSSYASFLRTIRPILSVVISSFIQWRSFEIFETVYLAIVSSASFSIN